MKKIAILTTARSDYYLLKPLIYRLKKSKKIQVKIITTGSHLTKDQGLTYKIVEKDFGVTEKLKILKIKKNKDMSSARSLAIKKYEKVFKKLKLDGIIILGDRYEAFFGAISSFLSRIPIIHIHGGEITEGVLDDTMRHVITKLSNYHFVSHYKYRKRVLQLGEKPEKTYLAGSLGVENLKRLKMIKKNSLEKLLKVKFLKNNYIVTYHPETLSKDFGIKSFKNLLKYLSKQKNTFIFFTRSNADVGNYEINSLIKKFVKNYKNSKYVFNLGDQLYFSILKHCNAIVGNSSSGIIEAPSLKIPTINIGNRQQGRISSGSVVNCFKPTYKNLGKIFKQIKKIKFLNKIKKVKNVYDFKIDTSLFISKKIEKIDLKENSPKKFYDLKS